MKGRLTGRHPLAVACALSAALGAGFFLALDPRYATNDDPLIAMLPAGTGFAAAPDEHLVFSNVLVGLSLRHLHAARPGVPWYAAYLLATHLLALTGLLYAALRARGGARGAGLFLVYFAVAAVPFANNLQFTVAAFVAAQAGLLLAIAPLLRGEDEGEVRLPALAAVGLAVLGSLIRFEAFLLALALTLPAAVAAGWRRPRAAWAGPAAVVAAAAVLALGARAFDAAYYARAADWAEYRAFNRTLAEFVDFERANDYTAETAPAFRAAGWSRNDHRLFLQWFHPDDDVFATASLRAVLAQSRPPESSAWPRLADGVRRIARNRPARPILLALPLALLACGAARGSRTVAAGLGAAAFVLVYLAAFRKAPPHVYLPVLASPLALALVLPRQRWAGGALRAALAVALAVAGAAAAWSLAFQRAESEEGRAREEAYRAGLDPLRAPPERFYVLWSTFPYHVVSPLASLDPRGAARFLALGWPQRTPAARRMLAARGYDDVLAALGDARTRLVAPVEAGGWIEQYARRHRGRDLRLVPEGTIAGMAVFRCAGGAFAGGPAAERVLRSAPAVSE
jgi:hypothetical protein